MVVFVFAAQAVLAQRLPTRGRTENVRRSSTGSATVRGRSVATPATYGFRSVNGTSDTFSNSISSTTEGSSNPDPKYSSETGQDDKLNTGDVAILESFAGEARLPEEVSATVKAFYEVRNSAPLMRQRFKDMQLAAGISAGVSGLGTLLAGGALWVGLEKDKADIDIHNPL